MVFEIESDLQNLMFYSYFCLVVDFKFKLNLTHRDPHRENVKFSEVLNLCSEIYKFSRI
ncbi:hypothetical protein CAMRE0001_0725 [Campylobacter rectus RM3267]|uniref:Uncharacterized protein n=1 Tax=Campylobacter rectus RM3267 TaxID=553218 RepID=B9CZN5_CAMRE|nr:hypothetical protein CAMRE0001_0725 [Campylobacter rectus RM3267]